jgi:hypothetical protein
MGINKIWIDPFAGLSSPASITNDLNPEMKASYHLDAKDFLKKFENRYADGILFDPPYSSHQVKEVYDNIGIPLTQHDTTCLFWTSVKDEISRIVKVGGVVISCGWNSNGMGKSRGFDMMEVLLVHHGGLHNDTIVTVEQRADRLMVMGHSKQEKLRKRAKMMRDKIDLFETTKETKNE